MSVTTHLSKLLKSFSEAAVQNTLQCVSNQKKGRGLVGAVRITSFTKYASSEYKADYGRLNRSTVEKLIFMQSKAYLIGFSEHSTFKSVFPSTAQLKHNLR